MKRRLLWVFMWMYWVFNKPTTLKTADGGMNPTWYEWYRWRWNKGDLAARMAFSILTFRLNEPCPFTESTAWKKWYRDHNGDRTITRQQIHDKLTSLHLRSKTVGVEEEPKSMLVDGGYLNRDWTRWYAGVNGCTPLKAGLVASQMLAKRGIIIQVANNRFCSPEPDLDNKHLWKSWYRQRYEACQQEADIAYADKRLKQSRM